VAEDREDDPLILLRKEEEWQTQLVSTQHCDDSFLQRLGGGVEGGGGGIWIWIWI